MFYLDGRLQYARNLQNIDKQLESIAKIIL